MEAHSLTSPATPALQTKDQFISDLDLTRTTTENTEFNASRRQSDAQKKEVKLDPKPTIIGNDVSGKEAELKHRNATTIEE